MRTGLAFATFVSLAAVAPRPGGAASVAPLHDYRDVHAYPDGTVFDERNGWKRVTISDLQYKYPNATTTPMPERALDAVPHDTTSGGHSPWAGDHRRRGKSSAKTKASADSSAGGLLGQALKGIGKATDVIITWYTGNDLKNPSCWAKASWTPTDQSFVCALTLSGWTNRPKCLSFLELCHGSSKCIYVRVVDTCAGCAVGSHHVDLTKGAFSKLADLDMGILTVDMRPAQLPKTAKWSNSLWGPKS